MAPNALRLGRIRLIGGFMCACALVLVGRLYYLQAVRSDDYRSQADRQYVKKGAAAFDRGSILFSPRKGGTLSAAGLASGYTVTIEPKKMEHPEDVYNALSGILSVDAEELLSKIESDKTYGEAAKRVDEATKERIESLDLTGVSAYKEQWRIYPGGKSAANVLGIIGFGEDGKTVSGRYGLERYYNDILSRQTPGLYVNFFAQVFSDISGALFKGEESEGDIVTTIEPSVQAELERKISGVSDKWSSDLTGGIVMDPYTGEIYAMAVAPTFDPNDFSKEKATSIFGNPHVDRVYEMGSIIKPLAMAAGLDAGVITPESTYNDQGYVLVNGAKVSNFDGKGRGVIDMQHVLNESLNTGMAFVAQKLGNERLTRYFMSYGFGEETGIDLPGEVHGLVNNLKSPRDIEHVTASFGQGIAMTPIETVRALSALGNGGFLPNPHLVRRIEYTSGDSKDLTYDETEQVLEPETSETITKMLVNVVDKALLGGTVKIPRYSIAAKTGTAQIAKAEGGGYYDDRYLHSFFGYFPAYKPRFIVFLFTVYPKGAQYASHTLTMPFIDLTKFLINYYEIAPDR
ncbi:MAG: penicillin-binding protein 2 [Candidatus Taylorbacteria bacterium]|nr:penicillin-binding protein 2 [Candidatus Taylorbacteria bacterium]